MLEVAEAREIVLQHAGVMPAELAAVMSSSLGQVTTVDIRSDLDSPPFDKALMDGFAIRGTDCQRSETQLRIVEEIPAGRVPQKSLQAGEAARIFTGAMIPEGSDVVVRQERTQITNDHVTILDAPFQPGQFILRRGMEMTAGQVVMPAGTLLTPAAFGLMASVGKTSVQAIARPRVSILATGNELVEPNRMPQTGQIRNSNGTMLATQAQQAGALARYLGIATDHEDVLRSYISEGLLIGNVLVLAGGVSVGDHDRVPKVLSDFGVKIRFHQVRMKPGKPLLFGTKDDKLIFGLPGNPVSSFVGFELFVKPALRKMAGLHADDHAIPMTLTEPFKSSNERPTYHPAIANDRHEVQPLPWFGSPDLRGILSCNAFLILPAGNTQRNAGEIMLVHRIR